MFQLILTVFSIALISLLAVASINYLPAWNNEAIDVEAKVRTGLGSVEQAYDVATRAQDGLPPPVTAEQDGGFRAGFLPYLRLMPPSPIGYTWNYGRYPSDSSAWSNLNYFCLSPSAGASSSTTGEIRGIYRAKSMFSGDQFFVSTQCGSTVNSPRENAPSLLLHVTFFVAYTPGVTR